MARKKKEEYTEEIVMIDSSYNVLGVYKDLRDVVRHSNINKGNLIKMLKKMD